MAVLDATLLVQNPPPGTPVLDRAFDCYGFFPEEPIPTANGRDCLSVLVPPAKERAAYRFTNFMDLVDLVSRLQKPAYVVVGHTYYDTNNQPLGLWMGLSKNSPDTRTSFQFFDVLKAIKDQALKPDGFAKAEQTFKDGPLKAGTLQEFHDKFKSLWGRWHTGHIALRSCNFGGSTSDLTNFGEIMNARTVTATDRPMSYTNILPYGQLGPYTHESRFKADAAKAGITRIFTNPRDPASRFGLAILEKDPLNFAVPFVGTTSRDFYWWIEQFVCQRSSYPRAAPRHGAAHQFTVPVIAPVGSDTFRYHLPLEDGYVQHLTRVDLPVTLKKTADGWVVLP